MAMTDHAAGALIAPARGRARACVSWRQSAVAMRFIRRVRNPSMLRILVFCLARSPEAHEGWPVRLLAGPLPDAGSLRLLQRAADVARERRCNPSAARTDLSGGRRPAGERRRAARCRRRGRVCPDRGTPRQSGSPSLGGGDRERPATRRAQAARGRLRDDQRRSSAGSGRVPGRASRRHGRPRRRSGLDGERLARLGAV